MIMYQTCNQTYFGTYSGSVNAGINGDKRDAVGVFAKCEPFLRSVQVLLVAFGGGGCSWENSLIELLDCNCLVSVQQTTPTNQR